jgi:hypothetical protein
MKPEDLKRLIGGKRRWTEPLAPEDHAKGFKGWYSDPRNAELNGSMQVVDGRLGVSLFMKVRPLQGIDSSEGSAADGDGK